MVFLEYTTPVVLKKKKTPCGKSFNSSKSSHAGKIKSEFLFFSWIFPPSFTGWLLKQF